LNVIECCIANATDGAASMQGIYNGFSKWLSDESPGNDHCEITISITIQVTDHHKTIGTIEEKIMSIMKGIDDKLTKFKWNELKIQNQLQEKSKIIRPHIPLIT